MRVLCDFHHSSLLRSLTLLFEDRLGMDLYRPIGLEWFDRGFWAINDERPTAEQFLQIGAPSNTDGTPALNTAHIEDHAAGQYVISDPGGDSTHRACTLDFFKNNQFDYVIATVPAHVPIFKKLIAQFQPGARLIVQMGNNWQDYDFGDLPVLASVKGPLPNAKNAMFYHQEFDTEIFHPSPVPPSKQIYSFQNILQNAEIGWEDFNILKDLLASDGFDFKSFGGQCADGNMDGPAQMANKMREAMLIFHVKKGGDGFGHVIHNAYAVGRPIITRSSHYRHQLAEQLLVPGTCIDLDKMSRMQAARMIAFLATQPEELQKMGARAHERFLEVVDYNREGEEIKKWIKSL